MTKKSISLAISLCILVIGVAIGFFAKFDSSDIISFAVTMFAAGSASCALWEKREKTSLLTVSAPILVGIGAFILGFGGFSKETMTTVITSAVGFTGILAGLIVSTVTTASSTKG